MLGAVEPVYQPRLVDSLLERRIAHHPAVMIVGPRAAGKTTSAERLARTVIRLDRPAEAGIVRADPDAAIRGLPEPILIDEWQLVPEVLGAVKRTVDSIPRPGRFIITGSVRAELEAQTWPGTGRLMRVSMFGLTQGEILGTVAAIPLLDRLATDGAGAFASPTTDLDLRDYAELALRGGFPEPVLRLPSGEQRAWLDSYLDELLTRDVAELSRRRDPVLLRRYLEAYAVNTAGTVDQETLRGAAGVAKDTASDYGQLLQRLFVVHELPAWWTNRLKRLLKAPKRYVVDPALALAALRFDLAGLMRDSDVLGRVLDTFVTSQLRAELPRCETSPRLLHLRQEGGLREVDLLIEYGGQRVFGIEVKATSAPRADDARHLAWLRDTLGDRFIGGAVLHTGPRSFRLGERIVAPPIAALWNV